MCLLKNTFGNKMTVCRMAVRCAQSHLSSRLTQPQLPQLLFLGQVLQPHCPGGSPLSNLWFTHVFPALGAQTWMQYSRGGLTSVAQRKCFLDLLTTLPLIQPRMLLAYITARAPCWIMFGLKATTTPRSYPEELFSGLAHSSAVYAKCRALHFS